MSVVLAATWNPRGEAKRFRRLYPELIRLYAHVVVVLPPGTHIGLILSMRHYERLTFVIADDWPGGRRESLLRALEIIPMTSASHIQYADMDRLLRWAETRYEELRQCIKRIQIADCLVIGRTEHAYATHPRALIETEALPNRVFSHILNQPLDLSAGTKGFCQQATRFIVENSSPGRPFGTDSEWVVLARRGGFRIQTVAVDGMDWESADRYADEAATEERQRQAAADYDADPVNWQRRIAIADEIITAGIDALKRSLPQTSS